MSNFEKQSTFRMDTYRPSQDPAATLSEIRALMERSSRFISLSGLSGISAGLVGLAGAAAVFYKLVYSYGTADVTTAFAAAAQTGESNSLFRFLLLMCVVMLVLALGLGIFFTTRRARRQGHQIWDVLARRLAFNLAVPLFAGGVFCLLLFFYNAIPLVIPGMLLFFGLALLNAAKYTLDEIRYLALTEISLGLVAGFWPEMGLVFWAIGFGICPVFYGIAMYNKYERQRPVTAS